MARTPRYILLARSKLKPRLYYYWLTAGLLVASLSACGGNDSMSGESLHPLPTIVQQHGSSTAVAVDAENQSALIDELMDTSPYASSYAELYVDSGRSIILIKDDPQRVAVFLSEQGIPKSNFEVRIVNDSLTELEQLQAAAEQWLDQFPGDGGVSIDVPGNRVILDVERQPLIDLIGFDPGEGPVPYEQWPNTLKQALSGLVPGIDIELRPGIVIRTAPSP